MKSWFHFVSRGALLIAIALAAGGGATAHAGEAEIRRVIGAKLKGRLIESVRPAPLAGLYEVVVRGEAGVEILYTDRRATVILIGHMIDARNDRDLTQDRLQALSAIRWDSLPLQWAFVVKHGSGRRKIAIFSDPNCPFCRRFEGDLARLGDVTMHMFLYPVINPDSVRQTKAVWCSRDRARAWTDLMLKGIEPQASPDCDTPIERILELGRKLGAEATPTWFLQDGIKRSGAMRLEELLQLIDIEPAAAPRGAERPK